MGDKTTQPSRLGAADRMLAYRPRLAVAAGLALGLLIIHLGLFGGNPLVPGGQRLADGVVIVLLLAMLRRLRTHFAHRRASMRIPNSLEALVWVLAGACFLAPAASVLGMKGTAEALSLSSLSLLTKLVVIYLAVRLSARLREVASAAEAPHLAVPAAAAVVISFGLCITFGTVLLSLPAAAARGAPVRPVDALFTATSASCVTGLIVLDTPRDWSLFGQIVILVLLQIGGLGTMTMASVLRMLTQGRSSVVQRLAVQDTVAPGAADVLRVVRRIIFFTLLCEGVGALLLTWRWISQGVAAGRAAWLGLFHAVSAFCNAGFSLFSTSLESYASDAVVTGVVGLLIVLGGLGFPVVLELAHWARSQLRARRVRLSLHTHVVLLSTVLLLLLGFALFLVVEWDGAFGHLQPQGKLLAAAFASITPRTAGFDTVAPADFSLASKWVTMALMFIGASPGSTGGGIKTATAAVLLLVVISMARGRQRVHVLRRTVGEGTRHRAFAIAALMAAAVFAATFALALTERTNLSTVLFEVLSALGTVGLSLGLTPMLSTAGRLIISLAMYMGRVGPLTLALAVPPARPSAVEFPQEEMMVG